MHEVTRILNAIDQGDPQAADQLLPLVYDELRKLAFWNGRSSTHCAPARLRSQRENLPRASSTTTCVWSSKRIKKFATFTL